MMRKEMHVTGKGIHMTDKGVHMTRNGMQTMGKARQTIRQGLPVIWLGIAGVLACNATPVLAAQSIEREARTTATPSVSIEIDSGYLTVEAWDKSEVRIEGELDDRIEEWRFDSSEDTVDIVIEEGRGRWGGSWGRSGGSDTRVRLYLPKGSRLSFEGINTSMEASGLAGRVDAETVNGNIKMREVTAAVDLSSVNGSILAENISGNLELATVNGKVMVKGATGEKLEVSAVNGDVNVESTASDIEVEAVSGDVDMKLKQVQRISMSLVSGDLNASLHLMDGGRLTAEAVSGDLNLVLIEPVNIRVSAESMSGDLENQISDVKPQRGDYIGNNLEFTTGDASARVQVNTVSGDLTLRRSE